MIKDRDGYRRTARGRALIAEQNKRYQRSAKGKLRAKLSAARDNVRIRGFLHELKSVPCSDCGGTFHPTCMDFDHRPGETKLFNIAASTRSVSMARIRAEIAKCDVVCANCHRLRTWNRRWERSRDPQQRAAAVVASKQLELL